MHATLNCVFNARIRKADKSHQWRGHSLEKGFFSLKEKSLALTKTDCLSVNQYLTIRSLPAPYNSIKSEVVVYYF